jgi:hypothetical protein
MFASIAILFLEIPPSAIDGGFCLPLRPKRLLQFLNSFRSLWQLAQSPNLSPRVAKLFVVGPDLDRVILQLSCLGHFPVPSFFSARQRVPTLPIVIGT